MICLPNQQTKEVPVHTKNALNAYTSHSQNDPAVSHFAQISSHFPTVKRDNGFKDQKVDIVASQHCELTLALHFVNVRDYIY